eukprot:6055272-Pyramimonas_sp.AAC.1
MPIAARSQRDDPCWLPSLIAHPTAQVVQDRKTIRLRAAGLHERPHVNWSPVGGRQCRNLATPPLR